MSHIEGLRLSRQQARLWRVADRDRLAAESWLLIKGPLDLPRLRAALETVIERHEILRTRFHKVSGLVLPLQVAEAASLVWESRDGKPDGSTAQEPFDLANGPVMTAIIHKEDAQTHHLHLTLPALCADWNTSSNLLVELADAYAGSLEEDDELLQYFDFSEWQNELHEGGEADEEDEEEDEGLDPEEAAAFWRERIIDSGSDIRLAGERHRGAWFTSAVTRAHAPSQHEDHLLAALWCALLYRMTGDHHITLNNIHHGRIDEAFEEGFGLFAAHLPLALQVEPEHTIAEIGGIIKNKLSEMEGMLEYVDWEHPGGAGFDFEARTRPTSQQRGDLSFSLCDVRVCQHPFKIKLTCIHETQGTTFEIHYDSARYQVADMQRLAETLAALAEQADKVTVAQLWALPQTQRAVLLDSYNQTQADFPADRCIHQLFEDQAKRTPHAVAVSLKDQLLTYTELEGRANQLAHALQKQGVGCDAVVGLCLERSLELVVGILGILKAGAAYTPIDPAYPVDRTSYILKTSKASLLLTQHHLAERFDQMDTSLCLDRDWSKIAAFPETAPDTAVHPSNLAYLIFTSGSTGLPKGVAIPHDGAVNYISWCIDAYRLEEGRGAPVHSSIGFDLSVTSLLTPLLSGKTAVMIPDEEGVEGLKDVLERTDDFSLIKITPSHLRMLNAWMSADEMATRSLRLVVGGEALFGEDCRPWLTEEGSVSIINEYGPTEAVVGCCIYQVQPNASGPIPIGKPIANARLYVLDHQLRPVPAGVAGLLYAGGVGLARAYVARPALTAERFIPDPFGPAGARMYDTGDLVRFTGEDPILEFLGRNDQQVKVRGYRIELGEIEEALKKHGEISEAVVHVHEEQQGHPHLVSWYVADQPLKVEELRQFLSKTLPDYMLPAAFVPIDAIPLTPNGKLDRDRLPDPDRQRPDMKRGYAPPQTPEEKILTDLFGEVLGLEKVGIHDNFFALGGDSILSVRVVAMAREHGLEFSVQQLFQNDTAAELASHVTHTSADQSIEPISQPFELISAEDRALLPEDVEDAYPLSGMQLGMLYHMEVRSESAPIYHNVNSMELHSDFDADLFQQAVDLVVADEPILRTGFDLNRYSQPMQLVYRTCKLTINVEDLRHLTREEQESVLAAFLEAENYKVFDMSRAPLLRLHFHRLGERRIRFTLTEPHSISDGWSTHLTMEALFRTFQDLYDGKPAPPAENLGVTYRDFIKLELDALSNPETQTFWKTYLEGASATQLPRWTDRDKLDVEGHYLYHTFDPALIRGLSDLARAAEVPFKSATLALHMKALALLTGRRESMTAVAFNGRPEVPGGDRVRGLFLNSLPFRFVQPQGSWQELLRDVYRVETELMPHRRYPLAAIQKMWGSQPLFEVGFNYIHFHSVEQILSDGKVEVAASEDLSRTDFPLGVSFIRNPVDPDGLSVKFEYDATRFPTIQVEDMRDLYLRILECMVNDPQAAHDGAELLPLRQRRSLEEWNKTNTDYQPLCLHALIEAQAEKNPEATAVLDSDGQLSYTQLNARANQLARFLINHHIKPEDRVALFFERSLDMAVAVLATLKTGAAYVPLDPEYPAERLRYLVADSGAKALLTHQQLMDQIPESDAPCINIDAHRDQLSPLPASNPNIAVNPAMIAYVIYTSGSTGKPKGTMMPHGAIGNTFIWRQRDYPLNPGDAVLMTFPFAFDPSVWDIFGPLIAGATLVLSLPRGLDARSKIPALVAEHQVTAIQFPAARLKLFLEEQGLEEIKHLKYVYTGGEFIPKQLQERFTQHLPGATLYNCYGPTEAALDVTAWECFAKDEAPNAAIGKPIHNVTVHVLDAQLRRVPIGTPGELYVGGAGLLRGYSDRGALTAEKVIPNPFSDQPGQRLYATGDVVRLRPDGNLEFIGRVDYQVKIRGYRVELGEIEAALRSHPNIRDTVVIVREDDGVKRLIGYVVTREEADPWVLAGALREHLISRLPGYMVPSYFIPLPAIPLNVNGKVDHKALPSPKDAGLEDERSFVPPRNETESTLAKIWGEVLGVDKVGVHDNFFESGGDSILSIRLVARAKEAGFKLSTAIIFRHQTIEELARVAETGAMVTTEQGAITGPMPLTPIQSWFFESDFPNAHHWNQAVMLEVGDHVESAILRQVSESLLFHHDALRMRYEQERGVWKQTIDEPSDSDAFIVEDFTETTPEDLSAQIEARAQHWQERFDLAQGPLLRIVLFETGHGKPQRLLIIAHHLVVDGVSWRILLEDLQTAYQRFQQGASGVFPPKTTSFKSWSEKLLELARSDRLTAEWDYWLDDRRSDIHLPTDYDQGANTVGNTATLTRTLDADKTEALLKDLPAVFNIRTDEILLTALVMATHKWTGKRSLVVDIEGHGREELFEDVDVSRTIGWFTSLYPLLLDLGEEQNPGDIVKSIKEQIRAVPHRGLGYGILRYLGPAGSQKERLQAQPHAQIAFNYLGQFDQVLSKDQLFKPAPESHGVNYSKDCGRHHLLEVGGSVFGGKLSLGWTYSVNHHREDTIQALASDFFQALETIIETARARDTVEYTPSDFEADLSADDLDDLLDEFGDYEG